MNNFFNKKEDYTEDEFIGDREDFLNPSMKDMDSRNHPAAPRKSKKIPEGGQFIDLTSLGGRASLMRGTKNLESREAVSMIIRGFVFIFMFLISLFAIFLIFKTPYYSMYSQKEPIILNENQAIANNNPFAASKEELQNRIVALDEDNTKIPMGVVSKNTPRDEDEMLQREFEKSQKPSNKKDTDLTKLLKNNVAAGESKAANNSSSSDLQSNSQETAASNNDTLQNRASGSGTTESLASNNNVNSPQNSANTQQSITPAIAEQTVWLVTIYSTPRQDEMPERLLRLRNAHKSALAGATFYFVENSNGGANINYRISVAKTTSGIAYPSFNNSAEAKSFCNNLKAQGLDCFVSTFSKSSLPQAIIK
ncbi:MAG: hypothetical protein FWE18_03905 [Alphaproteobacteria bacterium]|nr:hypothetical protein [Alphaproteobacteria bacterium]